MRLSVLVYVVKDLVKEIPARSGTSRGYYELHRHAAYTDLSQIHYTAFAIKSKYYSLRTSCDTHSFTSRFACRTEISGFICSTAFS